MTAFKSITKIIVVPAIIVTLLINVAFAQVTPTPSAKTYPQVKGFASILHPIMSQDSYGSTFNFDNSYTVVFPIGVNIWKSDQIGFSFELAPIIKVDSVTNRVNNLLFHPGIMVRSASTSTFTFMTRLAFETNGRYGITPILNQVVYATPNVRYFVAVPFPLRFGNEQPVSISTALQLGITF